MNPHKFCVAMIAVSLAAPLASVAEAATALKPITHEILWMMKRVGTPEDSRHFYEEIHQWLAMYLKDAAPASSSGARGIYSGTKP